MAKTIITAALTGAVTPAGYDIPETPAQIAEAIQAQLGLEVDRKRVGRGNNIKTSGKHAVEVNLYREITATVNVLVGVTEEEATETDAEAEAEVVEEATEEVVEEAAE